MTWRQYGGNFDNPINPEFEQEARLVEQSRAGSERAFSALLARYQQPVFRLILYLVGDENEARDLTRIAIKNALLHMPGVPAGYSIRPWLLRVAVLVALDAVRERSETPEDLIASLQLPPPPGPPRIVDADPADSETMVMHVSRLESLARNPETTVADAWDELPIEIERELIRRLLAGLPEGDAELLALGVVGQIPTRDLAALAGTSQRSIRRRIARALIMFQCRYTAVRLEELPPAPEKKELPPSAASVTPSIPLVDRARRGLAEASDRVRRGLQSMRQQFTPAEAEERLQTLRTNDVPPAAIVPPSPDIPPAPEEISQPYQSYASSNTSPLNGPDTGPLTGEVETIATPPGTFEPHSYANWTVPAPELDVAERPTVSPPGNVTHPLATEPAAPDVPAADTVILPPAASQDAAETPESASVAAPADTFPSASAMLGAAAAVADASPASDSAPPAALPDVAASPSATNPSRVLPRYGPPPEDVVTDTTPLDLRAAAQSDAVPEEPSASEDVPVEEGALEEDAAEDIAAPEPIPDTAPSPAKRAATSGVWLEVEAEAPPAPDMVEPLPVTAPDPEAELEAAAVPAEASEQADVHAASDEQPDASAEDMTAQPSSEDDATAAFVAPAAEAPAATSVAEAPPAPMDEADGAEDDALASVQIGTNLAEETAEPPHAAADSDAVLPEDAAPTEPPAPAVPDAGELPAVVAIERSAAAHPALPVSGSTVVIQPLARDDYLTRHRPAWLDGSDVGGIPGVTMTDNEPTAEPPAETPTVPALGALALPPTQLADRTPVSPPPADAIVPDMADLGDLTTPPVTSPDEAAPPDASALPPPRLRPPTRPMPHLEDENPDQPQEQ